ncbi:MAG: carbapenem-hydrolyzing beta-lactamase KPC [Syntrophaceae bacterium PtaB.Bin038]|nr:MAG: carbapenem-hydrolyzing beta-lactamase KPC [Syntrophaceae bacterium PtaB.Bin038]
MRPGGISFLVLLIGAVLAAGPLPAWAKETAGIAPGAVAAEIGRIEKAARGTLGVAAVHLETGRKVEYRAEEFFPMASTVKVPLAARILDMADRGQVGLATEIPVKKMEMNPEGPLAAIRWRPGLSRSIEELLEAMITRSDNTATDVLFRVAGGPAAVEAWLKGMGLKDIRPARYIRELLRDVLSIPEPASPTGSLAEQFRRMPPERAAQRRARASRATPGYDADPRDQATPRAMLALLVKIRLADGVSAAVRSTLIPMMERTETGTKRIRGRLPAGTVVGDKTGTLAGTANDVGYVTLPGGKGCIALVVFVKGSEAAPAARETAIADTARLVYDYFLLSSPEKPE